MEQTNNGSCPASRKLVRILFILGADSSSVQQGFALVISIKRTFWFLSFTVTFLVIAGWSVEFYASIFKPEEFQTQDCHGIIRMFQLDGEANIPTWYQSTTLLLCSFLLASIWSNSKSSRFRRHWGVLSLIFLLLSFDEVACIHEGTGNLLYRVFHTSGIFLYPWVIPGGIFALVVFLSYLRFLAHLPKHTRKWFIIAGAIYVSGTLGWEMVGARYDSIHGSRNLIYMTLTVCEETFECVGIILFINALLLYLKELSTSRHGMAFPTSSSQDSSFVYLYIRDWFRRLSFSKRRAATQKLRTSPSAVSPSKTAEYKKKTKLSRVSTWPISNKPTLSSR